MRRVTFALVMAVGWTVVLQSPERLAGQQRPEATSLLGQPLLPPVIPAEARAKLEQELADALAVYDKDPASADAAIWLGRRTAYLGRYSEAIAIYTRGIAAHPNDARLYRHRGHRYITTRQLGRAVTDLSLAASLIAGRPDEVEPDGQPNARNIPTSTLQSNIWYHLGLAHYLEGDFARALEAYRECLKVSRNADMLVATSHWLYMTLRRLDRAPDARQVLDPVSASMEIIENGSYHRLLLMYKGELAPEAVLEGKSGLEFSTLAYGVGNWYFYNGLRSDAVALFKRIVEGDQWTAFGHIAAEAELARLTR
jgi:tetratricopeptide (TPR) repeat protein